MRAASALFVTRLFLIRSRSWSARIFLLARRSTSSFSPRSSRKESNVEPMCLFMVVLQYFLALPGDRNLAAGCFLTLLHETVKEHHRRSANAEEDAIDVAVHTSS